MPRCRIILVLALSLVLASGLAVPVPAQAAILVGGQLVDGSSTTGSVTQAGDDIEYTFTTTANRHVTFDVTATSWAGGNGAMLRVYPPGSSAHLHSAVLGQTPTFLDFTPGTAGTWRIVLDPISNSVGSATVTYLQDALPQALAYALPVTTAIASKGQNATYTLVVQGGHLVSCDITATNWTGGNGAKLWAYPPGSNFQWANTAISSQPKLFTFVPNVSGDWRIVVDPISGSTGFATFACTA